MAVLWVNHAFDSLKAISAYCPHELSNSNGSTTKIHTRNTANSYTKSSNPMLHNQPNCVINEVSYQTSSSIPTKMNYPKFTPGHAKNDSLNQKGNQNLKPGRSKFPTH